MKIKCSFMCGNAACQETRRRRSRKIELAYGRDWATPTAEKKKAAAEVEETTEAATEETTDTATEDSSTPLTT